MNSLRTKLSTSYIFVALISVLLISVLANVFLEGQFRQYIKNNLERQNKQLVSSVGLLYARDGGWNENNIAEAGINALERGLIVKVKDINGSVIWDATVHNNGMCLQMIAHMSQNMTSRYPNWKGGYVETHYPVVSNFRKVGALDIGYYGPFYFNDADLAFINTLNRIIFGVTVISLFIALIVGSFMAKRLSAPLARVINIAEEISLGNLKIRSHEKMNIKEINQLVSAINNLAETLEKQDLLRKRLTADVAHELRTPLATLQSHLEAMLDGIWKSEPKRLKVCYDEIIRLTRIVEDLGKLARYENESLVLHKSEFDLGELVEKIALNFESDFKNKGVTLSFNGGKELILADSDKISQVIINLIENGLKFTPKGGLVSINLTSTPQATEIRVKDNGLGIGEADLPYIFERFYRADKSRNRSTGGSGIGLAIVKAIVEAHHGRVVVHSVLNEGTEFVISLPKDNFQL